MTPAIRARRVDPTPEQSAAALRWVNEHGYAGMRAILAAAPETLGPDDPAVREAARLVARLEEGERTC